VGVGEEFDDLVPVSVQRGLPENAPAWAEGLNFRLPRTVLRRLQARAPLEGEKDVEALRMRCAYTKHRPISSRLPVTYQVIPSRLRSLLASAFGRWKRRSVERWARFPGWPLDLSADVLADLAGCPPSPFSRGPTPVLLTHDLDSHEGLVNLVRIFLKEEEVVGARSTSYVVPCAWPLDHALLEETVNRGHELGIHGYDHSNLTPYLSSPERQQRVTAALPLVERYRMIGYRAPSLVRTPELLRDLAPHYRYDSSIPTSGGLFPVPNNGCASARPFRTEGILEIPVTMPRDGSLRFLGLSSDEIFSTWVDCADKIARSGGVVVLLTHCEERFSGNQAMLDVYRRFLRYVAEGDRFSWSTPAGIVGTYQRHEAERQ